MSFQIVYEVDPSTGEPCPFPREYEQLKKKGYPVTTNPSDQATRLLYRCPILDKGDYPKDSRYIGNESTYLSYNHMPTWYSLISDLTIPTFFIDDLGPSTIEEIKSRGWERAFIKDTVKSLFMETADPSTWPTTPMDEISKNFDKLGRAELGFCVRKYLEPEVFQNERRYWVMQGRIHHSSGQIPDIVMEAEKRLRTVGGVFYTIDATPELIVEINPGESSDRKTNNTQDDFIKWIMEAFA